MYHTVIKHNGYLRTRGKCRKQEPQASVFYISRVFSNVRSVLSQCDTRLRLLRLLYDIDFTRAKQLNKTRFFYALYSDKTWVFDQSERAQGPIYVITMHKTYLDRNVVELCNKSVFDPIHKVLRGQHGQQVRANNVQVF